MKNYKFIITGKVQGVYYRVSVKNNAQKYNYSGYVKNLPDGSVEAAVTCDEMRLNSFIDILRQGSASSSVDNIKQLECSEHFNDKFEVR